MALYLKIPKRILYLAPRHKLYYVTTTVLKAQLDWFFATLLLPLGLFLSSLLLMDFLIRPHSLKCICVLLEEGFLSELKMAPALFQNCKNCFHY